MKAFEWLRRKVTAIKTMNGERLTKKEVVVTDSLNAHPSALNSNGETLLVRAERYLWERYEFRYNVLAKCYEYREVSKKTPIAPLPLRGLPLEEGQCRRMQDSAAEI